MKTMLRKLFTVFTITVLSTVAVNAQDKKITAAQLPAAAQTFIKQHFKGQTVSSALLDKEMFDNDYETVLSNEVKINFDTNGNWDQIESATGLPASVIPKAINTYLATNYKGQKVVQIDRKRAGYDIELAGSTELEFDVNGKFLRIDD
jgi:hypothetical protein